MVQGGCVGRLRIFSGLMPGHFRIATPTVQGDDWKIEVEKSNNEKRRSCQANIVARKILGGR